ncbi:hypothetical protein [Pseudonocardia nigra]|uniref:hypothetical protein n=1 Tax=Pseudonocardia nigra TaxID=1921578 RepID=UPI001C60372C|nr:hypothetical protein [Pseudonocardia nigra]
MDRTDRRDGCRFSVVRRGLDAGEVDDHLRLVEVEMTIMAADRDAALARSAAVQRELETARSEIERLRGVLRTLSCPQDSVSTMSDRLELLLRLAHEESGAMQAEAARYAAALIGEAEETLPAASGADPDLREGLGAATSSTRRASRAMTSTGEPDPVAAARVEAERLLREAAAKRARLDEAAIAARAAAEEEFHRSISFRCRAVVARLARLQADNLRTVEQRLANADEQIRGRLDAARAEVRRIVGEARREVDELHALRDSLRQQLAAVDLRLRRDPVPDDAAPYS